MTPAIDLSQVFSYYNIVPLVALWFAWVVLS